MAQKTFEKSTREIKPSSIIRRIDDLGRISIPKDFRRKLGITGGSALECQVTKAGVLFTPYRAVSDIQAYLGDVEDLLMENADEFVPEVQKELLQHLKDCQALLKRNKD